MNAKYFIDTNIFVYTFDSSSFDKQKKAINFIKKALTDRKGVISFQVIQEFLNVATRKFKVPMTMEEGVLYLDQVLFPISEIYASPTLYKSALALQRETGYSFYDSLIIAAAHEAGCEIIYSEDLQHNQKIHNVEIKNPFL